MTTYKGYIKGTNRKDSKIIEFFESKGGINSNKLEGSGGAPYIIQKDKTISDTDGQDMESYYNAQQEFEDWLNGKTEPIETYPENRWWINKDINSLLFVKNPNITTGGNPGFWRDGYNKSWSFDKSMSQDKNWKLATDDEILQRWEDYLVELNIEKGDTVTGAMFTTSAYMWGGKKLRMASKNKGSIDTFDGYVFLTTTGETIKLVSKAVKESPKEPEKPKNIFEENGFEIGDCLVLDIKGSSCTYPLIFNGILNNTYAEAKHIIRKDRQILIVGGEFNYNSSDRTLRRANPEEKGWLDYCIEHGSYKPLEEYQRVVKIQANTIQPTDDKFYVICYDVRNIGQYFIKDKCYLASAMSQDTMFRLEEDGEIEKGKTKPTWVKREPKSYESNDYSFRKATPQEVYQSFTRFGKKITSGRIRTSDVYAQLLKDNIHSYKKLAFDSKDRSLKIGGEVFHGTQPKLVNKITKFDKESYKRDLENLEKTTKVVVKFTKINTIPPKIKIINN